MASIDVRKTKSAQETKADIRHDDKEERMKYKHTNEHIDKSKTVTNVSVLGRSYKEVCALYDERVTRANEKAKEKTGRAPRKDQVTQVCFEAPCPEWMTERDDQIKFQHEVANELCKIFGKENYLEGYVHFDEVHEYFDPKENRQRTSLVHGTHRFVPVDKDGCLRAKTVVSRENIIRMNNAVNEMCVREFGQPYNNGKGRRGRSVEELKNETLKHTTRLIESNSKALEEQKQNYYALQQGCEDLEKQNASLKAQNSRLSDENEKLEQSFNATKKSLKKAFLQLDYEDLEKQNASLKAQNSRLSDENEKLEQSLSKTKKLLKKASEYVQGAKELYESARSACNQMDGHLLAEVNQGRKFKDWLKQYPQEKKELDTRRGDTKELNSRIRAKEIELQLLVDSFNDLDDSEDYLDSK